MKNYASRVAEDRQKFLSVGTDFGCQMMADYVAIALNDPDVMGSNTFGEERLQRLFAKVHELDRFYDEAFTSSAEADYVFSFCVHADRRAVDACLAVAR